MSRHQEGGTALATKVRKSGMAMESWKDKRRLGRWYWMKVGTSERSTYVATMYIPCDVEIKKSAGERVIDKYRGLLEPSGELRKPNDVFRRN